MLLPAELEGRNHLITLIRLLLSDFYCQINQKFWPHRSSNSRRSRFQHNALTDGAIGPYPSDDSYQITIVSYYPGSDWNPDPKIRPIVHEKQLSGSQIRISIRITPNFELGLLMFITSLLPNFIKIRPVVYEKSR